MVGLLWEVLAYHYVGRSVEAPGLLGVDIM